MLNNEKDFEKSLVTVKIKNIDNKFYTEFDYIRDVSHLSNLLIIRKKILSKIFPKRFEIYKTAINNRKKMEINKTIQNSNVYKVIIHLNNVKKVDFFNIEYILQEKNFLTYSMEEGYIDRKLLENIREFIIDIDFSKDFDDYQVLIKTQNYYKNKIDDLLGN
jgi:hypothetical protein